MAVEYEPTQDQAVGERHSQLHLAAFRYKHGINIASERDRLAVDLNDLEADLVNVEDVHIIGIVPYHPFLDVAQWDTDIYPVFVKHLAVDKETLRRRLRCRGFGEDDLTFRVDLSRAQIGRRRRGCPSCGQR